MARSSWWKRIAAASIVMGLLVPGSVGAVEAIATAGEGAALPTASTDPVEVARQAVASADGASARVALGSALLEAEQVDEALGHFEKALEMEPKNRDAQIGLARAKTAKGDFEGAVAILEKGVLMNPRPERMYYELGRAHEAAGEFEQAVASYRKALERLLR